MVTTTSLAQEALRQARAAHAAAQVNNVKHRSLATRALLARAEARLSTAEASAASARTAKLYGSAR